MRYNHNMSQADKNEYVAIKKEAWEVIQKIVRSNPEILNDLQAADISVTPFTITGGTFQDFKDKN